MSRDLIERLRAPDRHDPACPFKKHCYCDDGAPHDSVQHPHALEAADEIERLRAELSSLRGEREQDFGAMKAAEKIILRDYQLGNLTKIGVANRLRGAGFTLEYACKMAHGLAAHSTPDSDVIGRLVGALERIARLTPFAANSKSAHDLHLSVKAIVESALDSEPVRQALASIPSTEGSRS